MKNYKRINNILGWMVFVIASSVYILTSEPTMSFWDCGEYISTAYKLEVGHPPGAPLFQMIGRFFSLFAFGDTAHVARMVNTMSALSSGFTILFLFWTLTLIARKIVLRGGREMSETDMYKIFGAALVGSLAYTFTDSFWFSAVEGEVYAMSSFFTAIVFWAIFKWEEHADEKHHYRWLLLIAYLVGLSIGVHLLNLLAIPAITFVYYFKRYKNHDWKRILLVMIISVLILSVVMYIIIPWIVKLAGIAELFSVNSLGLPFNFGTIIYALVIVGLIVWGLFYTKKKEKAVLNTVILAFTFIIIGYTSFLMLVIRSNAETPLNENKPQNAMYLLSYLGREQYGDWPLLSGQYYNAPVIEREDGNPVYTKDTKSGKYVITDPRSKQIPVYDPRFTTIFPRMWANMEKKYADDYIRWGKITGTPVEVQINGQSETRNKPTFTENLRFFWRYQFVHMYYRYFMWNFAGKQSDVQGFGDKLDGNWKSGITFLDQARLGPQDRPESRKSKGDNSFYFLPLILGLIGLYYNLKNDKKSALIIGLLFFMTGLAIVIYLNQYSPQPRERDYAYAGSFYAFAFWIGLGVIQVIDWIGKYLKGKFTPVLVTLFCIVLVPGIMGQQGWDDHDRSNRYASLAIAEMYLNSCAKDAILFTNGDNDTFPLWYAQEVEGVRTDVRVVNLSLFNTDWYIDQMKRKAYDSDPLPLSMTRDKYRQGTHDVTYIIEDDNFKNVHIDVKALFDLINSDDSRLKFNAGGMGSVDYFPTRKFYVGYDPKEVIAKGYIPEKFANRLDTVSFEYKGNALEKNSLMIMDLLATNNWKRPVYFSSIMAQDVYIGLDPYFHLEGLAYRLLPVKAVRDAEGQTGEVNTDVMYDNLMNKFTFGNMNNPKVYLDEQFTRMIMNLRNMYGRLANALLAEGKKDSAVKVLNRCMQEMPESAAHYNFFLLPIIEGYYKAGELKTANQLAEKLVKQAGDDLTYLFSFPAADYHSFDMSFQENLMILQRINQLAETAKQDQLGKKVDAVFQGFYRQYVDKVYQPR
jgi:hypothetical protein